MKGKYLRYHKQIKKMIEQLGLNYRVKYSNYLKKNLYSVDTRKKIICINKQIEMSDNNLYVLIKFLTSLFPFDPQQKEVKRNFSKPNHLVSFTSLGVFYICNNKVEV